VIPAPKVPDKYWYTKYPITIHEGDVKVKATIHLKGHRQTKEVYGLNHKCNTLLADGGGGNRVKKVYQDNRVRKLMPIEYERLQTLPDNYTEGISDSRRYTSIGNGWTVDIIKIFFDALAGIN
jgi:site-specific DNA-cytosine methylase